MTNTANNELLVRVYETIDDLRAGRDQYNSFSNGLPSLYELSYYCHDHYKEVAEPRFMQEAFNQALISLGAVQSADLNTLPRPPIKKIAADLHNKIVGAPTQPKWVAPLDMFPLDVKYQFGGNIISKFSSSELSTLIDFPAQHRNFGMTEKDLEVLAKFHWLVVTLGDDEDVESSRQKGFGFDATQCDQHDPYDDRLPPLVRRAIFHLSTMPWEKIIDNPAHGWRPFDIKKISMVNSSIFDRPERLISSTGLSWDVANDGEEDHYLPLHHTPRADWSSIVSLDERIWSETFKVYQGALLPAPAEYFMVRTMLSSEFEAFQASISAIEACLGSKIDFNAKDRPKIDGNKNPGATKRLQVRINNIIGNEMAGDLFENVYRPRSSYTHGSNIETLNRSHFYQARALARAIVRKYIEIASARPEVVQDREKFLNDLLFHPVDDI